MGQTNTNEFQLAYSVEPSLGVPGTVWKKVEPDSVSTFGNTLTKVSRRPLGVSRQRRKGCISNITSALGYPSDVTVSAMQDHLEGFMFSTLINKDVSNIVTTAANVTADTYDTPAFTAVTITRFPISALVTASNFGVADNNGLKSIKTAPINTDTNLDVNETLVDETSPPSSARLDFAGYRVPAVDTITWTYASGIATMTSTGLGTLLLTLGLTPGQIVNIGSSDTAGTAWTNAFENATANDMAGSAIVKTITANNITFDSVAPALRFTDGTDPATVVDILFGQFIRNVATTHADYQDLSYQYEATWSKLNPAGGADMYSYSKGNKCDSLAITLPETDKATFTYGMVGTITTEPLAAGSRLAGASTATDPAHTTAFCTSSDILQIGIDGIDNADLTSDFNSSTITLGNGVTPKTVLGTVGAKFLNVGLFTVDITTDAIFTDPAVVAALNDNDTVKFNFVLRNSQGTIGFNIPAMTLGDGTFSFTVDDVIGINLSGEAFGDPLFDMSLGVSLSPTALPRIPV